MPTSAYTVCYVIDYIMHAQHDWQIHKDRCIMLVLIESLHGRWAALLKAVLSAAGLLPSGFTSDRQRFQARRLADAFVIVNRWWWRWDGPAVTQCMSRRRPIRCSQTAGYHTPNTSMLKLTNIVNVSLHQCSTNTNVNAASTSTSTQYQ